MGGEGDGGMAAGERRALDSQKSIVGEEEEEMAQTSTGMEKILMAVAASVMHSASGMSKWGIADITLGLYKLYSKHSAEGAVDTVIGAPVVHKNELDDMLEWLGWATAAYENEKSTLASTMKVPEEDIVKVVGTSAVMQPSYYIVVHHQRRCVVMGIRGTYTAKDVLTDLNPHSEPFEGGLAHSGMLAAARWLLQNEGQTLHDVLQANPGFALVLVGHSLGAGTASLLSLLLREAESTTSGPSSNALKIPPDMITCWGFGCPPCVDLNLANSASFINNVVLQDDVVARVSPAALEDLRSEIDETDWSQAFKDGTTQRMVVEMLQATAERFQQKGMTSETTHVYEKTKDVGYSALLSAGNTILSRISRTKPADVASEVAEPKKPNAWLTLGAAVATSFLTAASDRVKQGVNESLSSIEKNVQETDEGVAASALAANAATSTSESNQDILIKNRLFVPGILFHIRRTPLQNVQNQAVSDPAAKNQADKNQAHQNEGVKNQADQNQGVKNQVDQNQAGKNQGDQIQENQEKKKPQEKIEPQKFRYKVIKGTDSDNSRFSRIILSGSMLSDHSTPSYLEALVNALGNASDDTACSN
ncbi:hypothetical protein KC19_11G094100 [Ceratodon purpureus]|uniref:Fungal lipase-type domain-containing protein n=1 Tax=Ceratodon purpureus TaxID=3225 RepID=A0A8T0GEQ4_CERPU|nr:hypothetical protein KC19_11G094100 [Ceratodon purpureus]